MKFSNTNVLTEVLNTLKAMRDRGAVTITWRLTPTANRLQRILWRDPLYTFERNAHDTQISWRECDAACFAIRADLFSAIGGFDEGLTSAEDCDLAFRITKIGGDIRTLPHCWTEHNPPDNFWGSVRKAFWYERGNAQMARKNPDADYRANLDQWWKAVAYLLLHTIMFLPLVFLKVNYRQKWPKPAFRPLDAMLSYLGAWAYTWEWLFPGRHI